MDHDALGDVLEADIHFDYPDPGWISGWTQKEYVVGEGMTFGLGTYLTHHVSYLPANPSSPSSPGTHTLDQALVLFGRPATVTGFLRSNRGVDSDIDDTFTIILQYTGKQKNLLVTVKTAIVTHAKDQLKFHVRGTKGTYLKVRPPPLHHTPSPNPTANNPSSEPAPKNPKPLLPPASRPPPPPSASKTRASGAH